MLPYLRSTPQLGLMKNFVKVYTNGEGFKYLGGQFPTISQATLKVGIFYVTQMR
jgi:hypothetical protein